MIKMAIIGGTGVYDPQILEQVKEQVVENRYGKVKLLTGYYENEEIAFIARHGSDHSVPPHLINYRANIMALKQIGVKHIIGTYISFLQEALPEYFLFQEEPLHWFS